MKVGMTSLILWLGLPYYQRACSFPSLLSLLIGTTLVGSTVISATSDGKFGCSFSFVSSFSYSERLVYFPWLLNWHIYRGFLSSFFEMYSITPSKKVCSFFSFGRIVCFCFCLFLQLMCNKKLSYRALIHLPLRHLGCVHILEILGLLGLSYWDILSTHCK